MRRVRDFQQPAREQLILDLAVDIIIKEGVAAMTMEKLAARLPFSKGTLYNHYASIEDVLVAVSCQCMERHRRMFAKASMLPGSSRERFHALGFACRTLAGSPDDELPMIITESLLQQCSGARAQGFRQCHESTMGVFSGVVRDAIANGDLDARWDPEFVAYSVWSIHFGAEDLYTRRVIFRNHSQAAFTDEKDRMVAVFLDGLSWRPLSAELDVDALKDRVLETLGDRKAPGTGTWAREAKEAGS